MLIWIKDRLRPRLYSKFVFKRLCQLKRYTSTFIAMVALMGVAIYAFISGIRHDPGLEDLERLSRLTNANRSESVSENEYSVGRFRKPNET